MSDDLLVSFIIGGWTVFIIWFIIILLNEKRNKRK